MTKTGKQVGLRWFRNVKGHALGWLLAGLVPLSCGGSAAMELGGESHFLATCVAGCNDGLTCLGGVCTKSCAEDSAVCTALSASAVCRAVDGISLCDVPCVDVRECAGALNGQYRCQDGFCRSGSPGSGGSGSGGSGSGGSGSGGSSGNAGGEAGSGGSSGNAGGDAGQGGAGIVGASCRVAHQIYPSGTLNISKGANNCVACRCEDGNLVDCLDADDCLGMPIRPCPEQIVTDEIEVIHPQIVGSTLRVDVRHTLGCGVGEYALCYDPAFRESIPVQTSLHVIYDAHDDTCEAIQIPQLVFDLRPLATYYESAYQARGGLISTNYGLFGFGEMTCEERSRTFQDQFSVAEVWGGRGCQVAADCRLVSTDTDCGRVCNAPISALESLRYPEVVSSIGVAMCSELPPDCGPTTQDCPAPPEFDCINGNCAKKP